MRFLGKYELLEQHTVGTVETFSAQPIGRSELLLVHLFSLPALTKASPTNRDLLDYMERICPPALGAVLDGGQYDDGTQAYIVTSFPRDADALGDWVDAYKAMPKASAKPSRKPSPAPPRNPDADELREPRRDETPSARLPLPHVDVEDKPVGDFTRAFQAFGADRVPAKPLLPEDDWERPVTPVARPTPFDSAPARPVAEQPRFTSEPRPDARRPAAGYLSEQFAGLGEGAQLPTSHVPSQPPTPRSLESRPEPRLEAREPSREPRKTSKADAWPMGGPPEPAADPSAEPARAGEFTQFFRSPFAAPPPGESTPLPTPDLVNRPAPARSDFTQLFGPSSGGSLVPLTPEPLLEPPGQSERGNFTEIFRPVPSAPSAPPWTPEKPADSHDRVNAGGDYFISNTNSLPISPGKRDGEPVFRSSTPLGGPVFGARHDEGATRVFKAPAHEEAPAPPPIPEGESQYTRIINGPKREPAGPAASPGAPSAPAAAGGGLGVPLPKVVVSKPSVGAPTIGPSGIGAPQVAMPNVMLATPQLAMPQLHAPPPPPMAGAVPKMPPGPKPGAAKKPANWTAYAPLIIILNLIFLAAVGLVLYFVYKP